MEIRKIILSALLLAVGFILHQIIPGFIGGMTFDVQLAMLFVIIVINMDFKNTVATALASGIITAFTTKFPGGQIPNVLDKIVTSLIIYFLFKLLTRFMNRQVAVTIISLVGTVVSGTVFLASALLIVGLPAPFKLLFISVVIPTSIANTIITPILYNMVVKSAKGLNVDIYGTKVSTNVSKDC